MVGQKLYIGVDLGDRTYRVDAVKTSDNLIHPVVLPGQLRNASILSAVGKWKNGEYVLLREEDEYDPNDFSEILVNFKRKPTAMLSGTQEMVHYETGVKEMLRLTLGDDRTRRAICDLAWDCEEIVFCIGYPTNWTKEDAIFFHSVLEHSILGDTRQLQTLYGKPVRISEERESTAAFIYARIKREVFGIDKNTCVLVLDFGSSTVNVTALTIGGKNTLYNSGHNYFGGRMVDCLIADYYISRLSEQEHRLIADLDRLNRGIATSLILLAACSAKEKLTNNQKVRMETSILPYELLLTRETFDELLEKPLAPIVRKFHLIPESVLDEFGTRSWKQILTDYLAREKNHMLHDGIRPELVIAVGGGSLLADTQKICGNFFTDVVFLDAGDAASTISNGLALAAKREDQSRKFNQDVDDFLVNRMPLLVKAEIPSLANTVSDGLTDYMCDKIIIPQFVKWREGDIGYRTLNTTSGRITEICEGRQFTKGIEENPAIQKKIKDWSINKLGVSVAGELSVICSRYQIQGFTLDTLNVIKTPSISISGRDALGSVFDIVGTVAGVVTAFIAAYLSGSALILILEIIYLFLPGLAMLIFEIVMLIPGGPVILAGIAGMAVFKLIHSSWNEMKDEMMERICDADFPVFCRKAVSEKRIKSSINSKRDEIRTKIKDSISSGRNADEIAGQISKLISKQISLKLDEIRYAMEVK